MEDETWVSEQEVLWAPHMSKTAIRQSLSTALRQGRPWWCQTNQVLIVTTALLPVTEPLDTNTV